MACAQRRCKQAALCTSGTASGAAGQRAAQQATPPTIDRPTWPARPPSWAEGKARSHQSGKGGASGGGAGAPRGAAASQPSSLCPECGRGSGPGAPCSPCAAGAPAWLPPAAEGDRDCPRCRLARGCAAPSNAPSQAAGRGLASGQPAAPSGAGAVRLPPTLPPLVPGDCCWCGEQAGEAPTCCSPAFSLSAGAVAITEPSASRSCLPTTYVLLLGVQGAGPGAPLNVGCRWEARPKRNGECTGCGARSMRDARSSFPGAIGHGSDRLCRCDHRQCAGRAPQSLRLPSFWNAPSHLQSA